MLSILIPVYNYDVRELVDSLILQLDRKEFDWEIRLSDDNSVTSYKASNQNFIDKLNSTQISIFNQELNIGNAANRNFLIAEAKFDWILFLDVDTKPVKDNFIDTYVSVMKHTSKDLISGNIVYDRNNPNPKLLRWKYGILKEEVDLAERMKNPILHLRGANFAIRKSVVIDSDFPMLKEKYGFVDTRFFLQFESSQVEVIENPVFHLGLESNLDYFNKVKLGIKNALELIDSDDEFSDNITIVRAYKKIRFSRLFLNFMYKKTNQKLKKNLLSENPKISFLQIYKLLYLARIDTIE